MEFLLGLMFGYVIWNTRSCSVRFDRPRIGDGRVISSLQGYRNEMKRYLNEYARVGRKADMGWLNRDECERLIQEYEKIEEQK